MAKTTTNPRTGMAVPVSATRRTKFSMLSSPFTRVFVCFLTFLLTSCARETEIIDKTDDNPGFTIVKGKDGKLNFEISFKKFGESTNEETPTVRSAVDMTPETVVIELDEAHTMYATLEHAEVAVTTRSGSEPAPVLRSFEDNTRLHIIAYQVGGSSPGYACHSEYVVEPGGITRALRRTGPELTLIDGVAYKFVSVSYNTNSTAMLPTTYPASLTDIDPTLDLIWGQTAAPVTIGTTNLVTIHMTHKFSKINLTAKSELGIINTLSNVWTAGYRANMMDVETGILSNHSPTNIVFPFPATPNADSSKVTSIVFTGNPPTDPTFIQIGSINTAGRQYNDLSAMFAKKIESGHEYNLRMTIRDRETLLTDDLPPAGFMPYVGAFWKSNQRGERLIHMPRLANSMVDGAWKAEVIYGNWIVLDRNASSDVNVRRIGFTPVDMMANDASHLLPSSATKTVTGYLRPSGASGYQAGDENIYFRIGLLSTNPNPAPRYGMVLLTYAGNTLRQRIWIRQGEESDYVPGMNSGSLWSPYNMMLVASSSGSVDLSGRPPLEGGIGQHGLPAFTTYPTQAGYLYQWTNSSVAYHPVDPVITTPVGWDVGYEGPFRLGSICPSGYTVPSGGAASDLESLVTATRVAGYYADGWFDRWNITQSVTGHAFSAVSATTVDAGYAGVVFFSPGNNRSIFFPFAGYRVGINEYMSSNPGESAPAHGALLLAGQVGNYWSATATTGPAPEDNHSAFHLNLDLSRTGQNVAAHIGTGTGRHMKGYAHSIRCVRVP